MTTEFWITTLVIVATPGTGVLFTVAASLARGSRAGILAAFACTLGIVPHMLAAITGLAALLHTSAVAFGVVKYLGVGYLLYLAYKTWRDRSPLAEEDAPPVSRRRVIWTGILVNLLNPKLTIFFFAFLPQFVRPGQADALLQMVQLSTVFMLVTFVVFVAYALFASAFRSHVMRRPRVVTWMRRGFAGTDVLIAARLAAPES